MMWRAKNKGKEKKEKGKDKQWSWPKLPGNNPAILLRNSVYERMNPQ